MYDCVFIGVGWVDSGNCDNWTFYFIGEAEDWMMVIGIVIIAVVMAITIFIMGIAVGMGRSGTMTHTSPERECEIVRMRINGKDEVIRMDEWELSKSRRRNGR